MLHTTVPSWEARDELMQRIMLSNNPCKLFKAPSQFREIISRCEYAELFFLCMTLARAM